MSVFIYQWLVEDEEGKCVIRGFGVNKQGTDVCLSVTEFRPWLYIEHPTFQKSQINSIVRKVTKKSVYIGETRLRQKLYFDHNSKTFRMFPLYFNSTEDRKHFYFLLRKICPKIKVHEYEASPLLQFLCRKNIPSCGWVDFSGNAFKKRNNRYTRFSEEYIMTAECVNASKNPELLGVPSLRVFSFDIETYSSNELKMPDASIPEDVVFQIGVSIRHATKPIENILFTLSPKRFQLSDIVVHVFQKESDLLEAFCKFVKEFNPHILIGWNVFGFDIPYLYHRCKYHGVLLQTMGMANDNILAQYKEIKWKSSAYSVQEFHFLDLHGRLSIDLLPVVRRDYKLNNYKLKTVSTYFLGETKDPLSVRDIFEAYRVGVQGGKLKNIKTCGKYCVQDARLVLLLHEKLQVWIGLVEMARICNVGIMTLFTQGQQVKVFSQVYKQCYLEDRIVDSFDCLDIPPNIPFSFENYCGAFVFPPQPGKYKMVIPFDFTSLYPTTIIAYNIDYSTLVFDEKLPDSECNVISWKEGNQSYRFRFRKQPMGVIPRLLQSLLDQRNKTKKLLKSVKKTDVLATVYDKRQLAYKVSANSMYGAMGVQRGYLPCLPCAMCTTAMGRESIQKAAEYVQKTHMGKIIYGDSVHSDTLLYIKDSCSSVRIFSIEECFSMYGKVSSYPQFKKDNIEELYQKEKVDVHQHINVMTSKGWAPVVRFIRHKCDKTLFRIRTSSGAIIVTEDHSLLLQNGRCIKPSDLVCNEHCLLTVQNSLDISTHLYYQKEKWSGFYTQSQGKVCFDRNMDSKYMGYIYFTFLKKFPNCRYVLQNDYYYLDLFNTEFSYPEGLVFDVEKLDSTTEFVYDVETMDGSFHAGTGSLIVKNTDSIYCHFPNYVTPKQVWQKAKETENEFLKLFPPPMKLLFEDKIYRDFLILSKKRYMAYTCDESGVVDNDMTIRGVLLARRDNSSWTREFYETIVRTIMETEQIYSDQLGNRSEKQMKTLLDIVEIINDRLLDLMQWGPSSADMNMFIITKALNDEYKVRPLNEDLLKAKKRLKDLDILFPSMFDISQANAEIQKGSSSKTYIQSYIDKSKPAHVQLATKMEKRGLPISAGSRMEFIVLENEDDPNTKLGDKLEDPLYFSQHCDILRIDHLYYMKSVVIPLDQLIETVFKKKDIVKKIYMSHCQHLKIMNQWKVINQNHVVKKMK